MIQKFFVLFLSIALSSQALASDHLPAAAGHKIKVKLDNYESTKLVLGFHFGDKQYVKDTADINADGFFYFNADTLLPCGVYLLVLIPENHFIQVLIPGDDQDFTITTDAKDSVNKMKVKGSEENMLFYDYLRYINDRRPEADTLKAQFNRLKSNAADSLRLSTALNDIDLKVKKYQADFIGKHGEMLCGKMIKSSIEPEVPEFKGEEKEVQRKKYYYYRDHYFDNIDIADPCLLRSPVLFQKVDNFINKTTPQHPDSIIQAIDYILGKISKTEENYKFFLIHFLNFYAKSNIVGMDGVYVHIAKNYYCVGKAPWTKKEDLEKICDNAARLEPILIGKKAPNITVKDRNEKPLSLWDVDADYTVLFFWDPDCSHCKKAAPFMVDFAKKYHDKGVKIFSVCTAVTDKGPTCWPAVEEKGFSDVFFINTYDPYLQSRYKTLYDIRSTPQIFILNREHEIIMKRIGGEQLDGVMEQIMQFKKDKSSGK